ncbi:transposable element Tcb1 transposase [Trichonephila clavipes]|uniref:Transposable element Tcb1 transposase n=1 Tax=Trichonephila clavipes TaxID=2585209 RepID=A0A8X6RS46_TRICX|nr:transposable element Tcb1 transposase [Trichonephila clavipes]
MDDNARPHRANIVDECLQSEDITRRDWPAYSPDLNPVEHVFRFGLDLLHLRAKTALSADDWISWMPQPANLTVRCPQRYVFLFSFFIETRGESETYKKDGTDKDYTTNSQRFNIS